MILFEIEKQLRGEGKSKRNWLKVKNKQKTPHKLLPQVINCMVCFIAHEIWSILLSDSYFDHCDIDMTQWIPGFSAWADVFSSDTMKTLLSLTKDSRVTHCVKEHL